MPSPTHKDYWPALIQQLLLGTEQLALSTELHALFSAMSSTEEESHQHLLQAIGTAYLLKKGARQLPLGSLNAIVPSTSTEKNCSLRSIQHLRAILDGYHYEAMPEFAQLLKQHRKTLPPEALPKLFDECLQRPALWPLVSAVMGERGEWLARQHPEWSQLLPRSIDEQFDFSSLDKDTLIAFRRHDAHAAREYLQSKWSIIDYKTKAKLLPTFLTQLSDEDEDFLDECSQDKRKDVRIAAIALLKRLPECKRTHRLWAHAQSCFIVRGTQLQLSLPDTLPAETKKDGILARGSKMIGGLPLDWLCQLIGQIPFYYWEKHWNINAHDIVGLIQQTPYPHRLLLAFAESLSTHPHTNGMLAVIQWWLHSDNEQYHNNKTLISLLKIAPEHVFNPCLVTWLQQYGPFIPADSLAYKWLSLNKHQWNTSLSKIIVLGFKDVISYSSSSWQLWHYRSILETAAYQSPTQLLDMFSASWSSRHQHHGRWQADIEKLLQILYFRSEMAKELAKP